jgi:hypothetical protein
MTHYNSDPAWQQRASAVQNAGVAKYGQNTWDEFCNSVTRCGVKPDVIATVITQPDPVAAFSDLAKNSLLHEMQSGSPSDVNVRHAEEIYNTIRRQEREQHRLDRGRGPR